MSINVESVSFNNMEEIFNFENENRDFFESLLPPRPEGYHVYESFKNIMYEIIYEQSRGKSYMCILRNSDGEIIGRVNLHSIKINQENGEKSAELGYRIGEKHQGKGYASRAVEIIIDNAVKELGLTKVEAGTESTNIKSQKVLLKNGFKKIGEEKSVMKVNGRWVDGLIFEKNIKSSNC